MIWQLIHHTTPPHHHLQIENILNCILIIWKSHWEFINTNYLKWLSDNNMGSFMKNGWRIEMNFVDGLDYSNDRKPFVTLLMNGIQIKFLCFTRGIISLVIKLFCFMTERYCYILFRWFVCLIIKLFNENSFYRRTV